MNFEGTKMLKGQHFGRDKIIIKTTSSVDTLNFQMYVKKLVVCMWFTTTT